MSKSTKKPGEIVAFGMRLVPRKEGIFGLNEFFIFAALCDFYRVTHAVEYVQCCHNSGTHVIELVDGGKTPDVEVFAIACAASESFEHFWLLDECGFKGIPI